MSDDKRVTRSQKNKEAVESTPPYQRLSEIENNFNPTHRSTSINPFQPRASLSRSPERTATPDTNKLKFSLVLPKNCQEEAIPSSIIVTDNSEIINLNSIPVTENNTCKQQTQIVNTPLEKPRTLRLNKTENMANANNTTLQNALAEQKNPATPKFLSPPNFEPSLDSPISFIKKYDRIANCNGWSDVYKITYLGNYLQNSANFWYTEYIVDDTNNNNDWEKIKKDFIKEFSGEQPMRKLKFRLNTRKQNDNEDIKKYYFELRALAQEIDPNMAFETFRDHFENGLHSSYYETYYLMSNANMTYDTLKTLVLKLSEIRERALVHQMTTQTSLLSITENSNKQTRTTYQDRNNYSRNGRRNTQSNFGTYSRGTYNHRNSRPPNRFSNNFETNNNYGARSERQNYRGETQTIQNNTRFSPGQRGRGRNFSRGIPNTRCRDGRPRCTSCNRPGHYSCENENNRSQRRVSFSRTPSPNGGGRLN